MPPTASDSTAIASSRTVTPSTVAECTQGWSRFKQLQHVGIVLLVSLARPLAGSTYVLVGGTAPTVPIPQHYRLIGAVISEITSLLLLWYVMGRQGKSWKDIGWKVRFSDIPHGFGLLVVVLIVPVFASVPFEYIYRAYSGRWLVPKSPDAMFRFGISVLSIAFVCLNPFFEELIVRAYTMSEIMCVGGTTGMAIIISVAVQMSYHLYQGLAHAIALAAIFAILAVYYAQTRRIVPVVLAHLFMDVSFLMRGAF